MGMFFLQLMMTCLSVFGVVLIVYGSGDGKRINILFGVVLLVVGCIVIFFLAPKF